MFRRHPHLTVILLGAILAASCSSETQTSLRLTVHLDAALGIDQFRVTLSPVDGDRLVPEQPAAINDGWRLVLLVPDDWANTTVDVSLAGLAEGKEVARGQVSGTPRRAEVVDLEVTLAAPCTSTCTPGETRCEKAQIRLCQKDARGCATFTPPQPCPDAKPVCSNDACAAKCSDVCTSGSRRCRDGGYQVCGRSDAGCLDWGPVLGCSSKETCRQADGLCVLDCGGKPCTCQPGETQACQDLGECKGGVRKCVNGAFGDCEWQTGKQPEVCDGKDNDCSGTADDNLAAQAQACAKQDGVCQGAVQKCGGTGGWLPCAEGDYQSFAGGKGLVFEAVETRCDKQDNDCNGKTDEPASCCQPQCSGKACGAGDGCGGKCQSGSCSANAVCNLGKCTCEFTSCGAACCGAGDVCSASSACCRQDCSGRVCGNDPVCGVSCGACSGNETCQQGTCKSTSLGWAAQPAAKLTGSIFSAVGGSGSSDVWVVGGYDTDGDATHFDGISWQSRKPQGAKGLRAVWASSPTNAWVVGVGGTLLHHDGSSWTSFTAQGQGKEWNGVWGSSPGDIWAVGEGGALLHYDGKAWTAAPSSTTENLNAIWGASATDIWAGGSKVLLHFDGTGWKQSGPATWTVFSLSGIASNRIWAGLSSGVGYYDGTSWSVVSSAPAFAEVWAASSTDVWAGGSPHGAMYHYDGKTWSTAIDLCGNTGLGGVWGASATDVWVVCNGWVTCYH